MPQLFDIRTSILFQEGLEEGVERGVERGLERGVEQGIEQGVEKQQILMTANMLTKTEMSVSQIADLSEVSIEFVQNIKSNLTSGEWKHPDSWTDEQWEGHFDRN